MLSSRYRGEGPRLPDTTTRTGGSWEGTMKKCMVIYLAAILFSGCNSNPTGTDNTINATVTVAPYIIWTDPMPDAVGPNIMSPNNVVKIRFSHLMDTRSVIHATSILPTDQTVFIDTNRAGPVEGTTFDFPLTPISAWWIYVKDANLDSRFPPLYSIYYPSFKVAQMYTISVDTSAQDIYGNHLAAKTSFSFTPEPNFRVTDTYPIKNDTAISPLYASITVRFNANIDTSTVRPSFTISPQPPGNVYVYSGSWGFYWSLASDNMLAPETKYTAMIAASAKDVDGHAMPSSYSFSFTTAPYMVSSAYPTGNGVNLSASIYVNCNFLVDSATMASSFSISPAVNGKFQYSTSSFAYLPSSPLTPNTTYSVAVSRNLHAKNGTPIKNAYSFSFTTGSQ